MSGDWFVGQRVVCITNRWALSNWWDFVPKALGLLPDPVLHRIYTIARLDARADSSVFFALAELPAPCLYESRAFRPLVAARNDIAELQALLTPAALASVS